jgi:predicted HTH transcriptional regulator
MITVNSIYERLSGQYASLLSGGKGLLKGTYIRVGSMNRLADECARFKGTGTEEFIDHKTFDSHIGLQTEDAYNFVLRHINKNARVEEIYTVPRWVYPVKAVREVL